MFWIMITPNRVLWSLTYFVVANIVKYNIYTRSFCVFFSMTIFFAVNSLITLSLSRFKIKPFRVVFSGRNAGLQVTICPRGGIGRRARLRAWCPVLDVLVRLQSWVLQSAVGSNCLRRFFFVCAAQNSHCSHSFSHDKTSAPE